MVSESNTVFSFKVDQKITDVIKANKFTLSAEVIPPRNGIEQFKILSDIRALVDSGAQFLAVTKGAGGSLRGGSLPIAQAVKESLGVPSIAHFTCRDITPADVENLLIDHHLFGIRNILALRGDPPEDQPMWEPKDGSYKYAYELIKQIKNLNSGKYLERASDKQFPPGAREKTDFCIGAAVYPEHPNERERIDYFKCKVDAGAEFGITQMLFKPEAYADFMEKSARAGINIPILPGTRFIKNKKVANFLINKFKIPVPDDLMEILPEKTDATASGRLNDYFIKLVERFRSLGAPGLHLFVIFDIKEISELLGALKKKF